MSQFRYVERLLWLLVTHSITKMTICLLENLLLRLFSESVLECVTLLHVWTLKVITHSV